MKKYYSWVRTLHLYLGLLISPFLLLFAVSILVFNHPGNFNKKAPSKNSTVLTTSWDSIPVRHTDLLTAKAIILKLGIKGEIDFISKNDSIISFPVRTPGVINQIRVNKLNHNVSVTRTEVGTLRATTFLHAMPGQHNASMRGNSGFIATWRYIVDIIVYSVLFLTVSGVFLWYLLPFERKPGIYILAAGFLVFIGLLLLIF